MPVCTTFQYEIIFISELNFILGVIFKPCFIFFQLFYLNIKKLIYISDRFKLKYNKPATAELFNILWFKKIQIWQSWKYEWFICILESSEGSKIIKKMKNIVHQNHLYKTLSFLYWLHVCIFHNLRFPCHCFLREYHYCLVNIISEVKSSKPL